VFIVFQIGVSFFAGKIAHAVRSRNVILLAIVASGLSWLTLFVAYKTAFLYLAFALGGVSSGLFEPIGNSLIAKSTASKHRGTAIGNFAAFGDMGRIAVVAATTTLAGLFGVNNACAILFGSSVLTFLLATAFLAKPAGTEDPESDDRPAHIRQLLKNGKFRYATQAGIADSFSSASLYIFIPFLLHTKGISVDNSNYFNVIFFVGYMTGRLVLGRLADRYGAPDILIVGKVLMAGLIVWLTLASGLLTIIPLLFVLGIFTRGTSPIIRAMVADSMDEKVSFHDAFGAYSSASRGSTAICRPIYGVLMNFAGTASVFYVSAAVSLLTFFPAARYRGNAPLHLAKHTVKTLHRRSAAYLRKGNGDS
jgi:MFS transporter, FSR family, fosmidomycin resistance protein